MDNEEKVEMTRSADDDLALLGQYTAAYGYAETAALDAKAAWQAFLNRTDDGLYTLDGQAVEVTEGVLLSVQTLQSMLPLRGKLRDASVAALVQAGVVAEDLPPRARLVVLDNGNPACAVPQFCIAREDVQRFCFDAVARTFFCVGE